MATGPDHFATAEDMAERAAALITAGDPDGLASFWATLAQVHATLACAAATALTSATEVHAWAVVAGTRLSGNT